jgi:hypothetical protein
MKKERNRKNRSSVEDLDLVDDSENDTEEDQPIKLRKKKRKAEPEEDLEEEPEIVKPRREKKPKEEFDYRIKHNHDSSMAKLLRSRGVGPLDLMHGNKSFDLDDVVQPIEANTFGKVKKINKNKQLNWYESSYRRVLGQSWLSAGIGGTPSDARAKQLALHLFMKAIKEYQERDPRKNTNRSLPYWHHVYGGFGDVLRDMKSDFPSFIVISNITPDCTALKMEKVRDCLTKYNNMDIPVVVVCAGIDPYTLFTTRLYYPMRWGILLGNKVVEV